MGPCRKNRRLEGLRQGAQALLAVVLLAASAAAQTPVVNAGGIVNAADFRPASLSGGAVAQGSIFSLFGSELSAGTFNADSFPLPRQVSGVRVEVVAAGIVYEAPLLHVAPKQINAVFPSAVPVGPAAVRVIRDALASNAEPVKVVRSFPGVFTTNGHQFLQQAYSNRRQEAAAQHYVDGQPEPLTLDAPASPGGDVTLWTTGVFGPRGLDDVPIALASRPTPRVRAFVGGAEVEILYQGPSPCCAGVDQINIRLPLDTPLGCFVPIQLVGKGAPSNIATIAIAEPGQDCPGRENGPLRVYLSRRWQDGISNDSASTGTGRLLLDPNEIPPLGACHAYARAQNIVVASTPSEPETVEVDAPSSHFTLSRDSSAGQLGPGLYQVAGRGSTHHIPDFDGTLSVPSWSFTPGDLSPQTSPRELGLRFTWEGLSFHLANDPAATGLITAGRQLLCQVNLGVGEFTIGPETLSLLEGPHDWTLTAMISAPLHVETEGPEAGQLVYSESFVQAYDLGSPLLPSSPITLPNGDHVLAELATTAGDRSLGLMNRGHLHPDRGMLFFFPSPGLYSFWMSQTFIPLDIIWLDAERRIVSIATDAEPCPSGVSCPLYSPSAPAQFVLELASGEAARRNLQLGDQLHW